MKLAELRKAEMSTYRKRGGMKLTFRALTYTVNHNSKKKQKLQLLKNVTGMVAPAQMTALMGPSGSGKSTLLDVLAGRKTAGELTGQVLVGGKRPSRMFMRRYTGYVEQFDTLVDNLTVQEMLLYTAEMKLEMVVSMAEKREKVEDLLKQLALDGCRNVRIGSNMQRGISGTTLCGQAKRCNIGIALLSDPRLIFLDEPTSGLDSYTSHEVMELVKALTRTMNSITVCATIHSPSPQTFELFDKVIILLSGRIVYFGNNGLDPIDYFEKRFPDLDKMPTSGDNANCAEWLLSITTKADRTGRADEYADAYQESELFTANNGLLSTGHTESRVSITTIQELAVKQGTVTPSWWGLWILIKYRLASNYRDPKFLLGRIVDKLLCCVVLIILYNGLGKNAAPDNLINISSLLYMYTVLPGFAAISYMPGLVLERPLYVRERSDGLYSTITYLLSKMVEELLVILFVSLTVSLCIFYAVGFHGQWILFWLVYLVTISIGMVVGYLVAAWAVDLDVANGILPGYIMGLYFFTGYALRLQNLPAWIGWFHYLDFLHYAWASLMLNEFEHKNTIFIDNQTFLEYYGLPQHGITKWEYLGIEMLFFVMFFILAWLALKYKKHGNR
ncbi:g2870 [Coccomyxa viridis]|uniref:G2870 protein n=1 Tax=Coccomyxa viridis TaxID=1274662 RepID=A0ABP1FTH4_9CHLO